jgi:hypothetical protein
VTRERIVWATLVALLAGALAVVGLREPAPVTREAPRGNDFRFE